MRKKLWISFLLIAVIFAALIARLLYIVQNKPAQVAATQNSWTVTVTNSRGTIYDKNFVPFVNENYVYSAALGPTESLLAHVYSATTRENFIKLRDQLANGTPGVVQLTKPIGPIDGLRLFRIPVRYGSRLLAPHIIGYLDNSGINGISGIERDYNTLLTQYSGKATASFYVDGNGRYLAGIAPTHEDTTDLSVGGVVLTLDKNLQSLVENIGAEYLDKGAVVVLRPDNGEIAAMASFPSFQPDTIVQSIQADNGALLNRALSLYDCGSVFKMITSAAALENSISVNTTFECCGYLDVEGVRFHCNNRLGHGVLTMTEAFAKSCNLYYIQLAEQVGADALYSMATAFGLNDAINLTDSLIAPTALLPNYDTIANSRSALANFSFGQGYLMASPLHVGKIAAIIANDGVASTIHLINGFVDENMNFSQAEEGRGEVRIISSHTARTLRDMMKEVVDSGTGQAALSASYTAAGKTGTAETGQIINGNSVTQSWFVGYFPADDPQYVVCVLTEDVDNAKVNSTFLFRIIADAIYDAGLLNN